MRIDATRSVGELAVTLPEAVPVLEDFGVDYYADGSRELREVSRTAQAACLNGRRCTRLGVCATLLSIGEKNA
jgi:iron-sulfur cluster repair protein YtfE (RIC family)